MEKFTTLTGVAAPLPMINIDTDKIIPKQYLKTIHRTGLGEGLFAELRYNDDGSIDIYFSPKPPLGYENNWVQTIPGKGWFTVLRMYSPLKAWIDQSWRPSEIKPAH